MGLFDAFKKKTKQKSKSSATGTEPCYKLQILFVIKDWNSKQCREFVAVDIQKHQFYRVYEQLGAWMVNYYFVKAIETDEVMQLFNTSNKCAQIRLNKPINDWSTFTTALQDVKAIAITKEQLLPGSKF